MDEMNIRTDFTRWIIKKLIEKEVKKKLGHQVEIYFYGPIEVSFDDEFLRVHMGIDASIRKDEIRDILADLV